MSLYIFPDATSATIEVLRQRVPAEVLGVTFGTLDPATQATGGPPLPYVRVRLDTAYGSRTPATHTSAMRLNVYDHSEEETLHLGHICLAVLRAYPGGEKVRHFRYLTGPVSTVDPDTGAPMTYLTLGARLRPTILE